MKKYYFFIYKLTSPSGEVYIGQSKDLKIRFGMYKNLKHNNQPILYNSLKKYGWESFKIEIIFFGLCTQIEVNTLEEYHIKNYYEKGISLNSSLFAHGLPHKKGRIKNSKEIYQYNKKGEFIREWTYPVEISENTGMDGGLIGTVCKNKTHFAYSYFWFYVEENKIEYILNSIKQKEKRKGGKPKKVVQLTKEGEYIKTWDSATEAAKHLNIKSSAISGVLIGKMSTAAKFRWVREKDWLSDNFSLRPIGNSKKPIICINLETKEEIEYHSIKELSEELSICKDTIRRRINNKIKNKTKYDFKFKN